MFKKGFVLTAYWRSSSGDRVDLPITNNQSGTVLLSKLTLYLDEEPGPVGQKVDSAIHQLNLYLLYNTVGFPKTYLLDSDLSGG